MKYVLMNKNTEVLIANYDEGIKVFDKIIEIRFWYYFKALFF